MIVLSIIVTFAFPPGTRSLPAGGSITSEKHSSVSRTLSLIILSIRVHAIISLGAKLTVLLTGK